MKCTAWNSTLPERTKPLPRSSGLRQSGGSLKVRKVSKRFAKRRNPAFLDWLREQPCFLTGVRSGGFILPPDRAKAMIAIEVEAAHLPHSRATGATDLGGALPLARHLHREQHRIGITSWLQKYGLTVAAVEVLAESYATIWKRAKGYSTEENV